jgi:hypothetical protein
MTDLLLFSAASYLISFSAFCTVAPSCTMAMRARVMPCGIRVLDDVAAIDNASRALLQQSLGAFEDFLVAHTTATAHEHRDAGGGFDDLVVELTSSVGSALMMSAPSSTA